MQSRLLALAVAVVAACGAPWARSGSEASVPPTAGSSGMVDLPGGVFDMGSRDGEGEVDERPSHRVRVAPFAMDAHEVTVAEYAACVRAGRCTPAATTADWPGMTAADKDLWSKFCNADRADRQRHPVNCVDWEQATNYCAFVGKRLPTEEEWEYAARGTEGRTYPWGNDTPTAERMNGCGAECVAAFPGWKPTYAGNDGWATTAPVESYPAGRTPSGLYDMAGNVWEWTSSRASDDYAKTRTGEARVDRGGSWHQDLAIDLRAAKRDATMPSVRGPIIGFRCAAS